MNPYKNVIGFAKIDDEFIFLSDTYYEIRTIGLTFYLDLYRNDPKWQSEYFNEDDLFDCRWYDNDTKKIENCKINNINQKFYLIYDVVQYVEDKKIYNQNNCVSVEMNSSNYTELER